MKMDRVILIAKIYHALILAVWISVNTRFIEMLLTVNAFFALNTGILIFIFLMILQFIFDVWASIYLSEVSWKSIILPVGWLILLFLIAYLSDIDLFVKYTWVYWAIVIILLNLFFLLYYRYEYRRVMKYIKMKYNRAHLTKIEKKWTTILWLTIIIGGTIILSL
jgi:hypothetical protein